MTLEKTTQSWDTRTRSLNPGTNTLYSFAYISVVVGTCELAQSWMHMGKYIAIFSRAHMLAWIGLAHMGTGTDSHQCAHSLHLALLAHCLYCSHRHQLDCLPDTCTNSSIFFIHVHKHDLVWECVRLHLACWQSWKIQPDFEQQRHRNSPEKAGCRTHVHSVGCVVW